MRIKTKIKLITLIILIGILGICAAFMLGKNTQMQKAYAAENNCEYEAYGYTSYVKAVSYGGTTSGGYWGTPGLFKIMFYTEDFFGYGDKLNDGVLLNWRKGGFYLDANGPVYIKNVNIIKDGNYFASGFYSGYFYDGNYSMKVILESRESASILWTYTFTFNFIIDNTAPRTSLTANGTSVGSNNYTNGIINFSASDARFKYIYYRRPYYSFTTYGGANYTVAAREENNGWWHFYATDMALNRSPEVSIYLDTVKPVGKISCREVVVASGSYTNGEFSYTATDNSGSVTHSIKMPQSETWSSYTAGTSVSGASGLYRFRSTDRAGNVSDEYTIFLDSTSPQVVLYAGAKAVGSGSITNASHISFSVLDSSSGIAGVYVKQPSVSSFNLYINGSQLTDEGEYTFYAEDKSGNSTQHYTITLDRTAPTITTYAGSQLAVNNSYVNAEFVRFSASDFNSGIAECYIKKPNSNSYITVASGTQFSEEGKYAFYATDNAGNSSLVFMLTLDRTKPGGQLIAGGSNVQNGSYTNANYISFVTSDSSLKASFVKLPNSANFASYSSGSMYLSEGKYVFYSVDEAGNRTEDYSIIIDREPKPLTLENVVSGVTDKNVVISWTDGDPNNFAPILAVTINNVPYNKGEIIYTINTGKYTIMCEDFAGNIWTTEFIATTKNIKTETLQQQYFEGADNNGNIFAFATEKNALEFLAKQERQFVRNSTWNSTVWDTGIMMDETDSVNAANGNYFIYKSVFDPKVEVAYFTEKRLTQVVNLYAKSRIKSYFYFEKIPAKSYEGNDLFSYKNGFALLARSVEFYFGISVNIDDTPLIGQFYAELGQHLITIADLYGNSCDYTATIVQDFPKINYSVEEGKTNTVSFDREYKLSSIVTLTITDELDEMAMYYVTDSSGNSLGYFYRDEAFTLDKSGKYIVRAVNHFSQSQEFVLYISLGKPSVDFSANTDKKRLEVTINASGDRYAKLQSLVIYKSVDNSETWLPLEFDDYGKAISLDTLSYNFKTSGLYKVSVTDEFRTGIDAVSSSLDYIQPKPSGTLNGVENGGYTNGTVSFNCADEAKLTLKKNGELVAYLAGAKIHEDGFYELTFENSDGYIEVFTFTIDTVLPTVILSGVENNGITNTGVSATFSEQHLTATLYFNGELIGDYVSGSILGKSGKYTLTITDRAGNSVTFNFTIDKLVSVTTNVYNGGAVNSAYFTASEYLEILLKLNGKAVEYKFGDTLTKQGKLIATLTDSLGNTVEMQFTIIPPIVKNFIFNFDEVSNIKKILVNGEETRLNYGDLILTQSGEYTVEVVLEGGTYSFTITVDVTPPQVSLAGVENGGVTKGSVTLTDLTENATIKAYLNGIEFEYNLGDKLSEVGFYHFVITDIVGNETELNFEIQFSMNGGAVALTVIAILGSIGIIITIVLLRKRGKFSRKLKPKSEPDEG